MDAREHACAPAGAFLEMWGQKLAESKGVWEDRYEKQVMWAQGDWKGVI